MTVNKMKGTNDTPTRKTSKEMILSYTKVISSYRWHDNTKKSIHHRWMLLIS
ncbi:hypothetical protein [Oceanobacillus chungangensis]|uniref:hypothetical protein n=1 Tax=Oceanobacillus chungangensis TaxID=1229152 RepID=UPI001475AA32|nr:hypothetical protein [Oceanobacillus chungangensis]